MSYVKLFNKNTRRIMTIKASNILAIEDVTGTNAIGVEIVSGSLIHINHRSFEVAETQEEVLEQVRRALRKQPNVS